MDLQLFFILKELSAILYINKTTVKRGHGSCLCHCGAQSHERMEALKVHGLCDILTGFIWVKHPPPPQPGLKERKETPQDHFKAHIRARVFLQHINAAQGHPGRT